MKIKLILSIIFLFFTFFNSSISDELEVKTGAEFFTRREFGNRLSTTREVNKCFPKN